MYENPKSADPDIIHAMPGRLMAPPLPMPAHGRAISTMPAMPSATPYCVGRFIFSLRRNRPDASDVKRVDDPPSTPAIPDGSSVVPCAIAKYGNAAASAAITAK